MKKQIFIAMFVSVLFLLILTVPTMAASMNGKFSPIPTYYDGNLFTITFQELPPGGEAAVLMHNKSVNHIYRSARQKSAASQL